MYYFSFETNFPLFIYAGQPGIRSRFTKVNVLVPSDAPRIIQGDFLLITENNEIKIECISDGGKPAADVSIHIIDLLFLIVFEYLQ